ncbi:unnamed protein product [Amoebophrya sp. A120]|nr:unnamed protein product [Amoebophrya sp. A120]|eukprot:GSA120T00015863001.1
MSDDWEDEDNWSEEEKEDDWEGADDSSSKTKPTTSAPAGATTTPTTTQKKEVEHDDDNYEILDQDNKTSSVFSSSTTPPVIVNKSDAPSEIQSSPSPAKDKKKETLLPELTTGNIDALNKKDGSVQTINSFESFEVKQMQDVEKLITQFLQPKLFPASSAENEKQSVKSGTTGATTNKKGVVSKNAHGKCLSLAVEKQFAKLELKQMEAFQGELTKLITKKKKEEKEAEQNAKKEQVKADLEQKKAEEERLKKEAEEKGEAYVNDEDFFAGLE